MEDDDSTPGITEKTLLAIQSLDVCRWCPLSKVNSVRPQAESNVYITCTKDYEKDWRNTTE